MTVGAVPHGALGVSIVVLLYSAGCLTLTTLLTCLLISFGEAWSYITLFSGFTALSTLASIVQQIHYAVAWVAIKEAQFEKAVESQARKGLAFGGAAHALDQVLFFIQFYCYNVMAINVFFWTVALFFGAWGMQLTWLADWHVSRSTMAKIFSVWFPALIIGLMQTESLQRLPGPFIVVTYLAMFISLSMGSVLLVLILYKYIKTRRLAEGHEEGRSRWWASDGSKSRSEDSGNAPGTIGTEECGAASSRRRSVCDRALVVRFTIGFVILAVFEIVVIIFTLFQANHSAELAAAGKPDFSTPGAIADIALFLPGVTASLVTFLVFGTTKSWRQYRDLVVGRCGRERKLMREEQERDEESLRIQRSGLALERLPSIQKSVLGEQQEAVRDSENRIRMFVRDLPRDPGPIAEPPALAFPTPTRHFRAPSSGRVPQFHRPIGVTESNMTSDIIEVGNRDTIDPGNQVVQYERYMNKTSQPQTSTSGIRP